MERVIKYLATNPSATEIEDRARRLKESFVHEKTITAQIVNQDERKLLEAIAQWAKTNGDH